MGRDRLTFLVMTDPSRPARALHVSRRAFRYLVAGAGAFALFVLVATVGLFLWVLDESKTARLERENALLAANLERMEEKVGQLSSSLSEISERDRRYRLLAGLPDIDSEVRQVGIGGPGTDAVENEPLFKLNTALGGKTFETTSDLNRLLRQANLLQVSLEEAARTMESHRDNLASYPSIDPTKGWLASTFSSSRYHPVLNVRRPHEGIDLSAWPGTPVVATGDGQVTFAGWRPGYGYTVEIDHGNGLKTRYAHNQKNLKVRVGDRVRRGDPIAAVGSTGLAKGPHVHYEVLRNGRPVDPQNYRLGKVIVE